MYEGQLRIYPRDETRATLGAAAQRYHIPLSVLATALVEFGCNELDKNNRLLIKRLEAKRVLQAGVQKERIRKRLQTLKSRL